MRLMLYVIEVGSRPIYAAGAARRRRAHEARVLLRYFITAGDDRMVMPLYIDAQK